MNDTDPTVAATEPSVEGAGTAGPAGYQLGPVIGRGGMGEVLLAHDPDIGRDVALKRMKAATPDLIDRFLREARIQARLDHPAIVPVHEVGRDREGRPFFTMKRVTGTTLGQMLERGGESQQRLLRAFVEVCLAIDFAHARGVIHRDLKPSNVMLGDYGEVYVLDWGIARVLGPSEATDPTHAGQPSTETQVGTVLGTPGYMAPEQAVDSKVGPSADVYSLGKMLLDILSTKPDVAPELDAICTAARAEDPTARPTTRALADAVQAYLDGDRDLERRRQLAAEQIDVAQRAREGGKRSEAIRAAGRALALDPNAAEAGELLARMIVEVPEVTPPEVEASIEAVEQQISRERSRQSMFAYLAIWLTVPLLLRTQVTSWPLLVAVFGVANVVVALHWINARTARVPTWLFMAVNLGLVVLFAQWVGALQLSPLFVSALLVALASRPDVARRPLLLVVFGLLGVFLPLALERWGVFPPTFAFGHDGLTTWGNIIEREPRGALVLVIGGAAALILLTGRFAMGMTRARLAAQRQMHTQAWQLRQLLPRARTGGSE
jgi:eukaryotic-like serine/threonine-protein kinase